MSDFERLLNERYSCRGFLPREVPVEKQKRILALAQRTPSWSNTQPWQVVIASGAAKDRLREALLEAVAKDGTGGHGGKPDFPYPREYRGEHLARRRACGFALYEAVGVKRGDREAGDRQRLENFRFFGAPHVAIVTTDEAIGVYGAIDCGAYVNNFMLAAWQEGVATIAQAALAGCADVIRAQLGIPPERWVVCGISFGYEDPAHPANRFRTKRADLDEVVRFIPG